MSTPPDQSDWARLFRIARQLIDQVNEDGTVIESWTFGGGTALMLQMDHRESHDVDIFLPDPQYLPLLDPVKRDFKLEIAPADDEGDGARFQKFAFEDIGEIDFIVSDSKTENPTVTMVIDGRDVLVETIPEIIAKKIVYRGASLKPRDIFDIAAAGEENLEALVTALQPYKAQAKTALDYIGKLNPEFVTKAISQLQIRDKFKPLSEQAIDRAMAILKSAAA